MKNSDDKPQYKTYDFNTDAQRKGQHRRKTTNYLHGWWIGFLIIAIALGIVYGINLWQNHAHPVANTAVVSQKSKRQIDKITAATKKSADRDAAADKVERFRGQLKKQNNDGLTSEQRTNLQKQIDQESNQSAQSQEQTLLDNTPTKQVPESKAAPVTDPFSQTHTFSTIADAKNWANATKTEWLKAGYSDYTITANGQGYYVLRFLK
ncbi:hypothetical protein FC56_GL000892 [Lentilactobacillus senioris DSM 24302 = JCM 17472]|uniref:Uncharacterized protein n=1 Tax=Lentilactobacillus senioris DSM 24302 = JCM 17472 TaxID=1423802 RepID=A0A0R2CYR4_9LACO|nr:hypothetical protein [Lentilactobacillus senioris]KRM93227.1 hypothetical protein FC56_GL000892 [Lentilactobacillus senioris DSM 24302 = JCM 17472]